jgi:hypothetical protein
VSAKLIIAITLLAQIISLEAFSASSSLTWQKLALEENIQRKFNNTLSSVLKDNQYLVEVEAEITEPGAPNFGDNDNKSGPRVSDIKMEDSRGDYIAFSKMGLELPVLEKFLDEDKTKLMNLYRFNESYDLFKNISGVKVTVFLSENLPPDLVEIVKKVVNSSRLSVSGIKPSVKFENIALEWVDPEIAKKEAEAKAKELAPKIPEQVEPKIWAKDWWEWASRWGNAFGLILGALIIGIIALKLFKEWKSFMEKYSAAMAPKKEDEKDDKEKENEEAMAMTMPEQQNNEEEEMTGFHGFERFQQCLEQHPEIAVSIVKSWINESDDLSLLCLRGLAQQASAGEMEKLMSELSEQQRDKWKGLLGHHLEQNDLKVSNKNIFQEVIRAFLVPSRIKDGELLNFLMEMNVKTTSDFMMANKDQVGLMMNILSPSVVNKALNEVDDAVADAWLIKGTEFDMKVMDERLPLLKASLIRYKEINSPAPFAQRIILMIPTATPARESTLFRALAKAGNASMVIEAANLNFPSELVLDLPKAFLKEMMQAYPMQKRIELLYSRSEDDRNTLVDILAETGTPARDMLDMELENIERDASREASIAARAEEIWFEFVKFSRLSLAKNTSYAGFVDQIVKEWATKLSGKLHGIKGGKAA